MKITERGLSLIREFESLRLRAYRDTGGILTIGWGSTGPWIRPYTVITREEADALLSADVETAEAAVNRAVAVPLSQTQYDSLVSFTFNVGEGNLRRSTLLRLLNLAQYDTVRTQLLRWVYDRKGVVQPGLLRRRRAEADLFQTA